jgi:uncharacterized repeat protein (TIGR03803 family)
MALLKRPGFLSVPILLLLGFLVAKGAAPTYTVLHSFNGSDGAAPHYGLVSSESGSILYGLTPAGGDSNVGAIFQLGTDGSGFRVLKSFNGGLDGTYPEGSLALSGTNLYGTANGGGAFDCGLVFRINTDGSGYTVLKSFSGNDGRNPQGKLVLSGSTLYGTTVNGGSNDFGTVFKVNTDGSNFTVIKSFNGNDGASPGSGLALSGTTLYGTVLNSPSQNGAVFKVGTDGSGYTLWNVFDGSDYKSAYGGIIVDGSTLYGTTEMLPSIFKVGTDGSNYTVLDSFSGGDFSDIENPYWVEGALTLSGRSLYGTGSGGAFGSGLVFRINTDGSGYTVLKNFTGSDGSWGAARGELLLTGSTLFGTTEKGGSSDQGVVFALSVPPPLVLEPAISSSGAFQLHFSGLAGTNYTVLSASAVTGPWNVVTNISVPTNDVVSFEDCGYPVSDQKFFRVLY